MKNRAYFFSNDDNKRFKNNDRPDRNTYEELLSSIVFKSEDTSYILPISGGTTGQVIGKHGVDIYGNNTWGFFDISDVIREGDSQLLPEYTAAGDNFIVVKSGDTVVWRPFIETDLSNYLTSTQIADNFINKTQLFEIPSQSNNKIVVLDNTTNRIPPELVPIVSPEVYLGTWDSTANSPLLAETIFYPSTATTTTVNGNIVTSGRYYRVTVSGTQFSQTFQVGDIVISNGSKWQLAKHSNGVDSVNGEIGVVQVSFLRDGMGDLTKSSILTHMNDNDIHITTSAQTIYGAKTFEDGILTDNISVATSGVPLNINDKIKLPLNTLEYIDLLETSPLLTSVTSNYSVPSTVAIKTYIDTKEEFNVPHRHTIDKYEPTYTVNNEFEFTGITNLTAFTFSVVEVNGDSYARFDLTEGYTLNDLTFLNNYFQRVNVLDNSTGFVEFFIDKNHISYNSITDNLKDKRIFIGNDIYTASTQVVVDLYTFDITTNSYERIPFHSPISLKFIPNFENYAILSKNNILLEDSLYVNKNVSVGDELSAKYIKSNIIHSDYIVSQKLLNIITNHATTPLSADTANASQINTVEGQVTNTYVKLPSIVTTTLGSEVVIINKGDENMTVIVNNVMGDKIIKKGNATPVTQVTIEPYEKLVFTLIQKDNVDNIWHCD